MFKIIGNTTMQVTKINFQHFNGEKRLFKKCKNTNCEKSLSDCNLNDIPNAQYSKIMINKTEKIDNTDYPKHSLKNYTGCLLGGATGDALGWPVEFRRLGEIISLYGNEGITDLKRTRNNKAEITDDTQMTIFTADGLLKSAIKNFDENGLPDMNTVYNSYQNWLDTQYSEYQENKNGWISNTEELWANRAPGTTCTGSLRRGIAGDIENPINSSKGCGGVMRVAPVGLMYYKNPDLAFEIGARCAALTHGSPSAYLPAGIHSSIIADIIQGKDINVAVDNAITRLQKYEGHENTLALMNLAKKYANSNIEPRKAIYDLGEGWHGDEAIAISTYCILKEPNDFKKALIMAVNHDGDSDSTGAIVGNILGVYLGEENIPNDWKNSIELTNELNQLAKDLYSKPNKIEDATKRYSIY